MPSYQITSLLGGSYFPSGTTNLTYSFSTDAGLTPLSDTVKNNYREIFARLNQVININFTEVASGGNIAITKAANGGYGEGSAGNIILTSSYDRAGDTNGFQNRAGSHGWQALNHELGHALGLKHTFDLPALPTAEDNQTNSVMTYTFDTYEPGSFMRYDVNALQYLYGAKDYNTGDNTYQFTSRIDQFYDNGKLYFSNPYSFTKQLIWDSNGNDTLDFSQLAATTSGYRFDLKPGGNLTILNQYNATKDSMAYGTQLAYNMLIENVVNSSSNDTAYLNGANNTIRGYTAGRLVGNDTIWNSTQQDLLDLTGYNTAAVTQTRTGNDLCVKLGSNGSVTVKNYYTSNPIRIAYANQSAPAAPALPTLSIGDVTVDETSATASLKVSLSAASTQTVSVSYLTNPGTAIADWGDYTGDYLADSAVLSFAPGTTSKTISINLLDDTLYEGNETFSVKLSAPQFATLARSQGTVTIVDDELPPTVSIDNVQQVEGSSSVSGATSTFSFWVYLSSESATPVTLNYSTVNGTATAGSDYVASSGTLTFAPYETIKSLNTAVYADQTLETNESFSLRLTDPSNGTVVAQGISTAVNDDTSPEPALDRTPSVKKNEERKSGKATALDASDSLAPIAPLADTGDTLVSKPVLLGTPQADVFELGNVKEVFYNLQQDQDFALLPAFQVSRDVLQLHGTASDYAFESAPAGLPRGTAIYQQDTHDLIAVVQGIMNLNPIARPQSFHFV